MLYLRLATAPEFFLLFLRAQIKCVYVCMILVTILVRAVPE